MKFYIYGQCEDCQIGFDIFILQTNQSDKNFVRNISVFGSHPTFTLTNNVRDGRTLVNRVLRIEANLDTTGLYVAFRDRGACIYLSEVTVFYPVCDKVSLDFGANFTGMQFPNENANGRCFDNMTININAPNDSFNATCRLQYVTDNTLTVTGLFTKWKIIGGPHGCTCVPGYQFISTKRSSQCEGAFPYRYLYVCAYSSKSNV